MNTAAAAVSDTLRAPSFARSAATVQPPQQARHGMAGLAGHLQSCARARGRWFGLHCMVESVHAAVTPRFFTTILVASALIGLLIEWA